MENLLLFPQKENAREPLLHIDREQEDRPNDSIFEILLTENNSLRLDRDFVQLPSQILRCYLSPNTEGFFIWGKAKINGSLDLQLQPGIYKKNEAYPLLYTTHGIDGSFSKITSNTDSDFACVITPKELKLLFNKLEIITPIKNEHLPYNQKNLADYLFSQKNPLEKENYFPFLQAFVTIPKNQYSNALASYTPEHYGALPLGESRIIQYLFNQSVSCDMVDGNCINESSQTFAPLYYKLRKRDARYPHFRQEAKGIRFQNRINYSTLSALQTSINYFYTNTHWSKERGESNAHAFYLDTSYQYNRDSLSCFFGMLGGYSRLSVEQYLGARRDPTPTYSFCENIIHYIVASVLKNLCFSSKKGIIIAEAHPHMWDIAEVFSLQYTSNYCLLKVMPKITLMHSNIFFSSIKLNKPTNFNLHIKSKYFSYLDLLTSVRIQIQKTKLPMSPFLEIGYRKITMLTDQLLYSYFNNYTSSHCRFITKSYKGNSHTLIVGGGISLSCLDNADVKLNYSNEFGEKDYIHTINLSVQTEF